MMRDRTAETSGLSLSANSGPASAAKRSSRAGQPRGSSARARARWERRIAHAGERRELREKVTLVGGTSEELDRAFGPLNRYGKL
jgi:hypothetical protein